MRFKGRSVQKIMAYILAVALFLSTLVVSTGTTVSAANLSTKVLVNETFSTYAEGATWTTNTANQKLGDFTIVHSSAQPRNISVKSGKLEVAGNAIFTLSKSALKDYMIVEFDFSIPQKHNIGAFFRVQDYAGKHYGVQMSMDANNIFTRIGKSSSVKNPVILSDYQTNTVYKFKVCCDVENKVYDVFIDGKLVADDFVLETNPDNIEQYPFTDLGRPVAFRNSGTVTYTIDNFKVYMPKGDTIIATEDFERWPDAGHTFTINQSGQQLAGLNVVNSTKQPTGVSITNGKLKVDKAAILMLTSATAYDDFFVEFDFTIPEKKNIGVFYQAADYNGKHNGVYLSCTESDILASNNETVPTKVILKDYEAGKPYRIKLNYNLPTQRYNVYVDNVLMGSQLKFKVKTTVATEIPDMGRVIVLNNKASEDISYYIDNIEIYANDETVIEKNDDDLYHEDFTEAVELASVEGWIDEVGTATCDVNPAADCDQAAVIPAGGHAYRSFLGQVGNVTATCDAYISAKDSIGIYLADESGNKLVYTKLDKFAVKNVSSAGTDDTVAHIDYPENSWFTVKLVLDTTARTYDVYLDDQKVNKAPLTFYNAFGGTDTATAVRFGFTCEEGKAYIDNLSCAGVDSSEVMTVKGINFETTAGVASKVPVAGGSLESAIISNSKADQSAVVIAALYADNGVLIDTGATTVAKLSTGLNTVNFADVQIPEDWDEDCSCKIFVWEKLSNMKPVCDSFETLKNPTVYLAGDSTVSDIGTVKYPLLGWGVAFKDKTKGNVGVINLAAEKNTSEYIEDGDLSDAAERLQKGDYLFVSSAYDDAKDAVSEDDYKANLKEYAKAAANSGAKCVFVTPVGADNANTYKDYMIAVATELNIPVLDLNAEWNSFIASAADEKLYYGYADYDKGYESDFRWAASGFNANGVNYDSSLSNVASLLSVQGASKAAELLVDLINESSLEIKDEFENINGVSYTVSGGTLTVSGSGEMPVYAKFADTPWNSETGITKIVISEGVETISSNAFSGFGSITRAVVAESVKTIGKNAFPSHNFTMEGYLNTAANDYGDANSNVDFVLGKLRILSIGNSHTADHTQYRNLYQQDMYSAGLKTEIVHDRIVMGGHTMYYPMTPYTEDAGGCCHTHYMHATRPNCSFASTYKVLDTKTYDLVIIQDYMEGTVGRADFAEGVQKTMRWLRNKQPQAEIAWVVDWSCTNSVAVEDRLDGTTTYDTLEKRRAATRTQFEGNVVSAINKIEALTTEKPDFIIPMGTALQNARTSYLGSTYNTSDCFTSTGTTDWAGATEIVNYTVLERDITHCSFELGRYLVGVAVYGKLFERYQDVFEGADFDYYTCHTSIPRSEERTDIGPWMGDVNDSIRLVIAESARNAITAPKVVTQSQYTVDPINEKIAQLDDLTYSTFTAEGIKATIDAANTGLSVVDVALADDGNSATVRVIYGYTIKSITVNK